VQNEELFIWKNCLCFNVYAPLLFAFSFSITEARDLRVEIVGRRGIRLAISTPESKPCDDINCVEKVGGLKMQPKAEIHGRKVYGSPSVKFGVELIGRSTKENTTAVVSPMDHSPGIGHAVPPGSRR
jgi:hypothetical protein